jgi:signal peptidase II
MRRFLQRVAAVRPGASNHSAKRVLLLLVVAVSVVAADQITKYFVMANMYPGQSIPDEGIVRLTYTTNTGGAFSLFANQNFLLALAVIIGITVLVIYLRFIPLESTLLKAGLGLDLGGAVGNLIDRLRFGEVTDFIDFGFWPVFNVADSAVVIGTILIAYYLLFPARKRAQQ